MAKEYQQAGKRIVKDGAAYFTNEYFSIDGLGYGYVFKDEKAFRNDPKAVCYIPENGFCEAEEVMIDGERCYPQDQVSAYTREDLEALVNEEVDCDTGEVIPIEYFFWKLEWAYPETYLAEMAA
jgi:hypothetical protein